MSSNWAAIERRRDHRPGAGGGIAAGQDRPAGFARSRIFRGPSFYGLLRPASAYEAGIAHGRGPPRSPDWRGAALPATARARDVQGRLERPAATGPPVQTGRPDPDEVTADSGLGGLLDAIVLEVSRQTAALCAGIAQEFMLRLAAARLLPRAQQAGALRVIREARDAALMAARRQGQLILHGRRQAALMAHRRPQPAAFERGRKYGLGSRAPPLP